MVQLPGFAQILDFPVNEKTKKISIGEQYQNLDLTADQLFVRIEKWHESFFSDPANTLYNVAKTEGRIFIDAYSAFLINSIEMGVAKEYLIRMNYNLRFFIRDGDLRFELTNITFGTAQKIKLITAEQFYDEWHLNSNLAMASTPEEKENINQSYQQYKSHTKVIIDSIIDGILKSIYRED